MAGFVAAPLAGCGPGVDTVDTRSCSEHDALEVTYPEDLRDDLIAAATEHAHERLVRSTNPLRGYAFEGRFQTESEGTIQSSAAALGLLSVEEQYVRFEFVDLAEQARFTLDYHHPNHLDRITPGDWDVVCPADLPVPAPSEPFRLPPTLCEAMEDGTDIEISVDAHPVEADDLDWNDLFFLNDLQFPRWAPSSERFEPSGDFYTVVDQASYRTNEYELLLYVDYEAHWRIDRDCPTSHAIVTLDILHAERCDISGHTHGRYDSDCRTIATIDGRPGWANDI